MEAALELCKKRQPNLALVSEEAGRAILPADWQPKVVPNWVRLLAHFPKAGGSRVKTLHVTDTKGTIDDRMKAQIAWICARHDRAWYALGKAKAQLLESGVSPSAVYELGGNWSSFSDKERAVFAFAQKLTVAPQSIVDDDVAGLLKFYSNSQVAEIVYRICNAALFNRLTEACALPLES